MKRNHVNAILVNQTKRRNTVFAFICAIVIVFVLAISFFSIYFDKNKAQYVSYDESSNIDYKVFLKENNFFDKEYLETNQQYIASLIDYITADFSYKLSFDEEIEYKYLYRVEANVNVKHKDTGNSLYNKAEVILEEKEYTTNLKSITVSENINIDYNYYNDLIKKFVEVYDLDDVESTLTLNMYINIIGSCENFEDTNVEESVMTLSIPLTTKTIAVDLSNDLVNTENNVMKCDTEDNGVYLFVVFGTIFVVVGLVLIVVTVRYEIKTRTAENIYEKELKKILNNYGSYIQTLGNEFNFKNYQLLKLDNFTDMLEVRDTIRQPILMKENEEKTGAYFVIPSSSKILYVYRLKVSDIEKEIQKSQKEI